VTRLEPRTLHQSGKLRNCLRTSVLVSDRHISSNGKIADFIFSVSDTLQRVHSAIALKWCIADVGQHPGEPERQIARRKPQGCGDGRSVRV
jgi:hypothetical protein